MVDTPTGQVRIEDIKVGELILTTDGPRPVTSIETHESEDVLEVTFSNGVKLKATPAHVFYSAPYGSNCDWSNDKRLDQLSVDQFIAQRLPYNGDIIIVPRQIVSIKPAGKSKVYDLFEKETDTWITSGIINRGCGEQPLPPYGACLLGSFNLVKYIRKDRKDFNTPLFVQDIHAVVRAMDNIIDIGIYPLPQQESEGKDKRRMGLGVTGLANSLEYLGLPYGSEEFISVMSNILATLRDESYRTSVELAKEKGSFPAFRKKAYLDGKFIQTLPEDIREGIKRHGIRNSHLTSIAPTGTISLAADNISSGIEPVYTYSYTRTIQSFDGPQFEDVTDYAFREWGLRGRTANDLTPEEHVAVLINAQKYVDSACSKTCNVGDDVSWDRFKGIYMMAFDGGAKGCTTYRKAGKRKGIMEEKVIEKEYVSDEDSVEACFIDPNTGQPSCS